MSEGRRQMEQALLAAVQAFAEAAERERAGLSLSPQVAAFAASARFRLLADGAYRDLLTASEEDRMRAQRGDPFHRLLAHPLSGAFAANQLSRLYLPNYFSFIHLVLGDEMTALSNQVAKIAETMTGPAGEPFDWDGFYEDPASEEVMWAVLVRIAEAFRRFDTRRDWFIALMQNNMHATSIGPNAFIPRAPGPSEPPPLFDKEAFVLLFGCLFDPLRDLTERQRQRFEQDFARSPEQVFGGLWQNLDAMRT